MANKTNGILEKSISTHQPLLDSLNKLPHFLVHELFVGRDGACGAFKREFPDFFLANWNRDSLDQSMDRMDLSTTIDVNLNCFTYLELWP